MKPALVANVAAPAVGLAAMLQVGGTRRQLLLKAIFGAWIVSPFVALWLTQRRPPTRPLAPEATIHALMLVVALVSIAVYVSAVVWPRPAQPAFTFLVVPAASWLLISGVIIASRMGRS